MGMIFDSFIILFDHDGALANYNKFISYSLRENFSFMFISPRFNWQLLELSFNPSNYVRHFIGYFVNKYKFQVRTSNQQTRTTQPHLWRGNWRRVGLLWDINSYSAITIDKNKVVLFNVNGMTTFTAYWVVRSKTFIHI